VTESTNTATAGGFATPETPGRPARRDRPVRFEDPARNQAYWARIDAIVDAAPPLTDTQRAIIRTAFHGAQAQEAA
jgi:hypothetical protein